jgi:hypothetical protein
MFDLLRFLFGGVTYLSKDKVRFQNGLTVNLNYVDTSKLPWEKSHIFELDVTHNSDQMILKGVEHLVDCLKNKHESISSGFDGREALRLALEYKKLKEGG